MARQPIGIGTIANDGTGDPLRDAFDKINDNFIELYDDDANDVNSVNGQTGTVILDTDDIGEGATNKYDKTVVLTEGDNVTITGTYPNFTISSNDVVGEVSSVSAGDGISVNSTTGNVIVTNTITNNNQLTNGAGYVDGSGTANYIAKFTDGDTIGDSVIYDNGTNVGIGTNSADTKLEVMGSGIGDTNILTLTNFEGDDTGDETANIRFRLTRSYTDPDSVTDAAFIKVGKETAWTSTSSRDSFMSIYTRDGANTPAERMRIKSQGDISFRDTSNTEGS